MKRMRGVKQIFARGEHFVEPVVVEGGGGGDGGGDGGGGSDRYYVLEAGARVHATAFVLAAGGGAAANYRLTVDLAGEGAEFHLHALYLASGEGDAAGRADIDVTVNHLAPGCTSRQLIKGIAAGEATGSFTGMVHVAPGAQNTDAAQRNQNLQLTDTAHVTTSPNLEIYADDVRCSHGATIGRLDEEAVYYMRQRGVSEVEARRMQMQGFAAEIVNRSPSEQARRAIGETVSTLVDRL